LTIAGEPGAQFNVRIRVGDGWNTGPIVFQNLFTKPGSGNEIMFIDVTSANVMLNVGETFVIETQGNDTGAGLIGSYVAPPGNPLYPEFLFLGGPGCFVDCGWRHGFNSYMLEGGGGFTIRLTGPCPGQKTLAWDGAGSGQMGILVGSGPGNYTIPFGPCAGTQLGLAEAVSRSTTSSARRAAPARSAPPSARPPATSSFSASRPTTARRATSPDPSESPPTRSDAAFRMRSLASPSQEGEALFCGDTRTPATQSRSPSQSLRVAATDSCKTNVRRVPHTEHSPQRAQSHKDFTKKTPEGEGRVRRDLPCQVGLALLFFVPPL
jgi:hypothetical protein